MSPLSSGCLSEMRLACMITSNHALFMQLNLGTEDESMRRFLGCPPDDIQVYEGKENKLTVFFRVQDMAETPAHYKERWIWQSRFESTPTTISGSWRISLGLAQHSLPALPDIVYEIEAHRGKTNCAAPPTIGLGDYTSIALKERLGMYNAQVKLPWHHTRKSEDNITMALVVRKFRAFAMFSRAGSGCSKPALEASKVGQMNLGCLFKRVYNYTNEQDRVYTRKQCNNQRGITTTTIMKAGLLTRPDGTINTRSGAADAREEMQVFFMPSRSSCGILGAPLNQEPGPT
ncbi:hypothetical protein DFH29DRAFT_1074311 [Suillus ampliporus]|nr:hypothetical protein DFH29DRAFT_1074311 [Suillus ampliporus]